jgi:hypothetical protein
LGLTFFSSLKGYGKDTDWLAVQVLATNDIGIEEIPQS